jgi:hypothetical protein
VTVRTGLEATQLARSLAERDALAFDRHGWEMPDDWPLTWELADAMIAREVVNGRAALICVMRREGQNRWDEMRHVLSHVTPVTTARFARC